MNGLVLLSLSVVLPTGFVVQGGVEFGWTQLPDHRVEYIVQLDEQAVEALKNGQPLTSSIPPEVQAAERIRIQYGTGLLAKPILSRKPQVINPPQYPANSLTRTDPGGWHQPVRPGNSIADTPPSLKPGEINSSRSAPSDWSGQVTVKQGNQNVVTNSSLSGARQTTYLTQETGTNEAIHWSNSNRVIGNYDTQDRLANSRSGGGFPSGNPTGERTSTGIPVNPAGEVSSPLTNGTARNNLNPGNLVGDGVSGTNNFSRGFASGNQVTRQPTTLTAGQLAPVASNTSLPTNNSAGWTSVNNPNRLPAGYNTGFTGSQNAAAGPTYNSGVAANPNPATGTNGSRWNPNTIATNSFPGQAIAGNHLPNASTYPQQPNGLPVQPPTGIPVSTASPSNEVAMLNKTIEEMKNEQRQREHDQEIAKLKAEQKAELEKLTAQFKEFQQKKQETPTAAVSQNTQDSSRSEGSSGIASVFLVISLGLNVFLVVQYLSVQNQFRDLSNDLRDTFMTSSYE